jgi:hypothetical protein
MTFQGNSPVSNENYSIATGSNSTASFLTLLMTRDPTANDLNYRVTQRWVNTIDVTEWILIGFIAINGVTTANWLLLTGGEMPITGTFVPTVSLSNPGSSSFTYSVQSGEFAMTGNLVFFSIRILLSNFTIGSGSGNVQVGTLPFIPGASSTNTILPCTLQNITFAGGVLWYNGAVLSAPLPIVVFPGSVSGTTQSFLQASALSNTSIINVTGTYFTS